MTSTLAGYDLVQSRLPFIPAREETKGRIAMPSVTPDRTRQVLADPVFRELALARAKLRWGLSIVTLILFFGFIALISTAKSALGANVAGSDIPLGLALALSVIVLVVLLTGFYVQRSNWRFDELARGLNRRFGQ